MTAARQYYFEDTCALKSDSNVVGTVDRTYSDVSTHHPHPVQQYQDGLSREAGVSRVAYDAFLRTGIPPRGCVLVTWAQADANGLRESSIIQEDKLVLLDRALLVADIVKKSPTDSMSGTVIRSNTRVTLMPPVQWPPATSQAGSATFDSPQGGLSFDPQTFLHDIPSHELRLTNTFEPGSFVVYGPWVGKIDSVDDEVTIRLGDGSLVVVEDIEELSPEQDSYYVNDFVHTKKANLRRGRWVFGTYNANVEPAGYVAQVRTISLEVEWLGAKWLSATTPGMAFHNQPPYELDQDILDSGHLTLYDESVTPAMISDTATASSTKVGLELAVGDRVRFKDLTGASVKYSTLKPIPRTETLGHDINTFVVQSTRSEVTVLWQDLTRTTCDSKELIPFLDIGEGEEVWPGEMIMTKTRKDLGEEMFAPDKFGVVQAVNSQERMAQVRWCTGEVVFSKSDAAPEDIMITNRAGAATGECEACSLYDITTLQVWERRVGDMVAIIPSEAESETQAGNDWFGEVVELGLDGLLTVRLGASTEPRDVMVPISRTAMLYSSDAHGGSDHGDEDDDDNSMSLDSDESMDRTHGRHAGMDEADVEWRDELDEIVAEDGDEGWTTEEDDLDLAMANNIDADMTDENTNGNTMKAPTASHETASVALTDSSTATLEAPEPAQSHRPDMTYAAVPKPSFSYSSMFPSPLPDASHPPVSDVPPNFDILDGTAPSSHHFSSSTARPEGPQLRRILKEHKILRSSLPDGVFVRTWEASLDLLRVLILGPLDTPYEYAPFVIDFSLEKFPQQAPQAFFHSWTDGTGPVNPNLYENGKICLSLLGTWPGDDKQETWTASKSTILQVLVSILGLVLVREPYYNEAGYEVLAGTLESKIPSIIYSERAYFKTRSFIATALDSPMPGLEHITEALYLDIAAGRPRLLQRAIVSAWHIVQRSKIPTDATQGQQEITRSRRVSAGAVAPVMRQVDRLMQILGARDGGLAGTKLWACEQCGPPRTLDAVMDLVLRE